MNRRVLQQKISRLSEGLLNNLTDLVLAELLFGLAVAGGGYNSRKVWEAAADAQEIFVLTPYTSFKNALGHLHRKGFLNSLKTKISEPFITQKGRERLARLFPTYEQNRPWDKKIYLITYDIPEERRNDRDLLRRKLKDLNCAYLQHSVWLTPYNPRQFLKEFAEENQLSGQIIISDTGTNGSIGEKSLPETLWEVYHLDELNSRYQALINPYQGARKDQVNLTKLAFEYFSILRDDPQLPFDLLPSDWLGDEAYLLYQKLIGLAVLKG